MEDCELIQTIYVAGPDSIYPVMLKKGLELIFHKLCVFLRTLGYKPKTRRLIPASFPKIYNKTLQKLLDRYISDESLTNRPLYPDQYAYSSGVSTETALCRAKEKAKYAYKKWKYFYMLSCY